MKGDFSKMDKNENIKRLGEISLSDGILPPVLDIYISKIPDNVNCDLHLPKGREAEMESVSNEAVKKEKRYAFLLLRYAMEKSFGIKMEDTEFLRLDSGRWVCSSCEFSISHSLGYCAVAVSRERVGVDIERIAAPRSAGFAKRALTEAEFAEYSALAPSDALDYLISAWCKKESAFKMAGGSVFVPSSCRTDKDVYSEIISLDGEKFALGVAAKDLSNIRVRIIRTLT